MFSKRMYNRHSAVRTAPVTGPANFCCRGQPAVLGQQRPPAQRVFGVYRGVVGAASPLLPVHKICHAVGHEESTPGRAAKRRDDQQAGGTLGGIEGLAGRSLVATGRGVYQLAALDAARVHLVGVRAA